MENAQHRQAIPLLLKQPWLWFLAAFLLVGFGFWPSFLSQLNRIPSHILIHGISATLWMAMPVMQGWLILRKKRKLHRRLGYALLPLAAVVAISGLHVVQTMVSSEGTGITLTTYKFVLLDLTGIAMFAVFLIWAISAAKRHDVGLHLRLMACTAIIPLEAANERTAIILWPGLVPDFSVALYASLLSMELLCLALLVAEWKFDRVRWPFPLMLGYYLFMHAVATPVAQSPAFQDFAQWYSRLLT